MISGEVTSAGSTQRKRISRLLGLTDEKNKIGRRCDLLVRDLYDYAHLVGEVSGPPLKKLKNKERFDLGRINRNAKDEKSLCELSIIAEFGPILEQSDVDILLKEIYVFMIQVKSKCFYFLSKHFIYKLLKNKIIYIIGKMIETSLFDHLIKDVNQSRFLSKADISLQRDKVDKDNFLQFLFTIYELVVSNIYNFLVSN